jgi:hypothetical protein
MEQKTGHDLRTLLEKGREIARNFKGLFDDICKRPDIPTIFWRALIRNSANPRPIAEGTPVKRIFEVYTVDNAPFVIFCDADERLCLWYHGQIVFRSKYQCEIYRIFVGKDGVVDRLFGSFNVTASYYHVLPTPNNSEPFLTSKNTDALRDEFAMVFYRDHGRAEPWGRNGAFYRKTYDYEIAEENGMTAECVSGSIGDLQIGIVRCGTKLYQVILGWAEDFKDLPK